MAFYNITNSNSALTAVEFKPVSEGNLSFFYIRSAGQEDEVKRLLSSSELDQRIVGQARIDGKMVLVTRGSKSADELMQALKSRDITLVLKEQKRPFNAWAFRGNMSNIGQGLQLYSSISSGKLKPDLAAFSILNLTANFINIKFGGQKEDDKNQLLTIKKDLNTLLGRHLPAGSGAPDINEMHSLSRREPEPPPSLSKRFNDFMARNSVRLGEIGLRYLGSIVMVFPVDRWKSIFPAFKTGGAKAAFDASLNPNKTRFYTGITYLVGKTIALFSKVPDPYSPTPPGILDTIREKYVFKLSSLIETGAAGILAGGAFTGDFGKKKPDRSDYISGIGGSLFMAGLTTRIFASFGKKLLNTEEVFAYASDALAQAPRENLPQLVAESAGLLQKYLGNTQDFGDIYTRLMVDLYRYHNIALDSISPLPPLQEQGAQESASQHFRPRLSEHTAVRESSGEKQAFANASTGLLNQMPCKNLDMGSELLPAQANRTPV